MTAGCLNFSISRSVATPENSDTRAAPIRIIIWQIPPRTTRPQQVENGVQNLTAGHIFAVSQISFASADIF